MCLDREAIYNRENPSLISLQQLGYTVGTQYCIKIKKCVASPLNGVEYWGCLVCQGFLKWHNIYSGVYIVHPPSLWN